MIVFIRLFSSNNEQSYAQFDKKELGFDCACPFKDRLERINIVDKLEWK